VVQTKRDEFSRCDEHRPGRHKTETTPEIIDQIHELLLEYRCILAKSIAKQLGKSRERVRAIINKDLFMGKLSAKWPRNA
jgi:Spy/CpxP family protein refolding chaperone